MAFEPCAANMHANFEGLAAASSPVPRPHSSEDSGTMLVAAFLKVPHVCVADLPQAQSELVDDSQFR